MVCTCHQNSNTSHLTASSRWTQVLIHECRDETPVASVSQSILSYSEQDNAFSMEAGSWYKCDHLRGDEHPTNIRSMGQHPLHGQNIYSIKNGIGDPYSTTDTSIHFQPHSSTSTHFHTLSHMFNHFHLLSTTFTYFQALSSTFKHFHPLWSILSTFIHFHPLLSTFIHFYPLSSTFNHFHSQEWFWCSNILGAVQKLRNRG